MKASPGILIWNEYVMKHSSHLTESHLPGGLGGQKLNSQPAHIHLRIKSYVVIHMQIGCLQISLHKAVT